MTLAKYIIVEEVNKDEAFFYGEVEADDDIFANEAIKIMESDPEYDPKVHRLYVKVGGQEEGD